MTGLRRSVFVLAMVFGVALVSGASAVADLDDDLAEVNERIDNLEERLEGAAAERTGIVAEILEVRDRLNAAQAELDTAEDSLREVRLSLAANEFELGATQEALIEGYEAIAETRRRIETSRVDAQDWVRQQYMRRAEGEAASMVLTTDRVTDIGRIMFYIGALAQRSTASIDRHQALGVEEERQQARNEDRELALETIRATLLEEESKRSELSELATELTKTVRRELRSQQTLLDELDGAIADFETEIDGLEREQDRLQDLIKEASGGGGSSPGQLVRPVPGAITSPFGPRLHPILGYTRMHTGVDMTAPLGQDIRAGAAGTVILAETYGGYGLTVIVDHGGGMTTLYAHQSRLFVSRGEKVTAGEVVGEAGSTGLATGPHLHFEVRLDGTPVDPADYL
ncbi:MAG: peptidoglycan DD-metalloendopeptidase family protein [Acidimicrobiia bacterium]|nr:peptidoglycan DD-metalloendopeptidase family protein [Acidimicrobiia bacterium]